MQFMFSDKVYNKLKVVALVILPAVASFYFGLAAIWGLPAADKVVGTISVVDTFLGVALGVSSKQYQESDDSYDGTVKVTPNEKGSKVTLHADPSDLIDKDTIKLKVLRHVEDPPL